jgi:hypothetical protein
MAERLGLTITDGRRGSLRAEPSLPFFIEWAPGTTLAGYEAS